MFNPAIYENSRPDGMGVLEIVQEGGQGQHSFVPLKRSELHGEVVGPLADLRLRQTFGYTHDLSTQTLEALYRFPLPGDAAVTQVTVRFGDVEIVATLQARDAAEAEYEAAKQAGRQAALAQREAPDVFTLQVAGLQPDQEVSIETHYVQLARPEEGRWTLRIPLTTAPRYVRSDERGSRTAQGQPLALLRDPGHRFLLDLTLRGVEKVESPTHELAMTETDDSVQVRLQAGEVIPDRDCVLQWRGRQAEQQPRLALFVQQPTEQTSTTDSNRYFLAQVTPPRHSQQAPIQREVLLLVDHSGSMTGPKWAAADWAVERFLGDLRAQDSFALGIFHDTTRWFAPQVQMATPQRVTDAITWLKQSDDSGGTELGVALEQALRLPRSSGEAARHLLILTDAAVTDSDRILRLADQERERVSQDKDQPRRRISVICIDAAPNAFLAQELVERGGGVAKFLTSDPEQEDISTALDEVLTAWAEPLYANLRLHIQHPTVEVADQQAMLQQTAQSTVIDLGDLAGNQTRWIIGRLPRIANQSVKIELQRADGYELASRQLGPSTTATTANLRALFGARRVNGLEYLMHAGLTPTQIAEQLQRLGYDPAQIADTGGGEREQPPIYAENVRAQSTAALRDLLIAEALRYGLASAETAFVATRQEAGQRVQGSVKVANALPAGWSDQFLPGGGQTRSKMAAMSAPMFMAAPAMNLDGSANVYDGGLYLLDIPDPSRAVAAMPASSPPSMPSLPTRGTNEQTGAHKAVVFQGEPTVTQDSALLYSSADHALLPEMFTITGISLRVLADGAEAATGDYTVDRTVAIHLFVGDLTSPRARIRLQDLLRYGDRPLNLQRSTGQPIQITLVDPTGWLAEHSLRFELLLHW